jgi:WRKY transcription factor 33
LQFFPSPTTNAFASQQFSWLSPQPQGVEQGGKEDQERQAYPDFSFQTAPTTEEAVRTTTTFQQPPAPLVRSPSIHFIPSAVTLSWVPS